jgi:hypothetical protein
MNRFLLVVVAFAAGIGVGWLASGRGREEPRQYDERLVGIWRPEPDRWKGGRLVLLRDGSGARFSQEVQASSLRWWTSGGTLYATYDGDEEGGLGHVKIAYRLLSSNQLELSSDELLRGGNRMRRVLIP